MGGMASIWKRMQRLGAVLRPAWLAGLISLGVSLALHHPQAVDVLVGARFDGGFYWEQHLLRAIALFTLAVCGWYFSRSLLYVRYWFTPESREHYEVWRCWVPRLIGAAPVVSLAVASVRAGKPGFGLFYATAAAAFLTALAYRRRMVYPDRPYRLGWYPRLPRETFAAMVSLIVLSLCLLVVFLVAPVAAPTSIGPLGIIFFAMASWIAFGSAGLIYPSHHYRLPSLFLPLIAAVTVFSLWNDNHQVRTVAGDGDAWERESVARHVDSWFAERRPRIETYGRAGVPYPVFVVAAEGGGIRAAYWTASVLASLEDAYPGFGCHVFAMSGASGGSLGAAVFSALIAEQVEESSYRCDEPAGDSALMAPRVREILGADFLSPALAGMLFPDFMQRLLPTSKPFSFPDRAMYLESAWEASWREATGSDRFASEFRELWNTADLRYRVPSLFLNGTWVDNGKRNVTSNVRPISPNFADLEDMVDTVGRPIRLSTAVHMSARFTYLSPAGTVATDNGPRRVVDGGYFENSGALTASEILEVVDTTCSDSPEVCGNNEIAIYALIVSNDPKHPANPDRPDKTGSIARRILPETLSPVHAVFNARIARGHHADRRFVEAVDGRVFRFQLPARDKERVPLGWVLAGETRRKMDRMAQEHPSLVGVGRLLRR